MCRSYHGFPRTPLPQANLPARSLAFPSFAPPQPLQADPASTPAPTPPAPVLPAWTPMRTYASLTPRPASHAGAKRGRDPGSLEDTSPGPLSLAGVGLSTRRTRQRGLVASTGAQRNVWEDSRAANAKGAAGPGRSALAPSGPMSTQGASPLMTETAKRIVAALDSMSQVSCPWHKHPVPIT